MSTATNTVVKGQQPPTHRERVLEAARFVAKRDAKLLEQLRKA